MDLLIAIFTTVFTPGFFASAVVQGMPLLFGSVGEIITEKAGHLNLGIPGIMYMGAIGGISGAFLYEKSVENPVGAVGVIIAIICALLFAMAGGLIYSVLTVTLYANQNVAGLALTTFGVGMGNFFGSSLARLANTPGQVTAKITSDAFRTTLSFAEPLIEKGGFIGGICQMLFSYGFMTYVALIIAVLASYFLSKTSAGLSLRAVGESPATADAAGINVKRYKYLATIIGAAIAGLGGLYFVMDYMSGSWQNDGFGDRGWLAIALVIFALWKPLRAIWGSVLFGGLYILAMKVPMPVAMTKLLGMLPYVVTLAVLIISSFRKKREHQPPQSLGLPYFREER